MRPELARYLQSSHPGARTTRLAGDASVRQFYRLTMPDGRSSVVMDYGAPFAGETDDVRLSRVFRQAALPVAQIRRVVPDPGCLVLDDLGDLTLEQALASPGHASGQQRTGLYERAVDLAVAVAVRGSPALAHSGRPAALDRQRFRFEMDFFIERYAGALRGIRPAPGGLATELHELADHAAESPNRVFCHRDFHSRNLMLTPDGDMAMVDIQDARWGPDSYDLASLLRDAYVDLDEGLVERSIERYRRALPEPPDRAAFRRRFDLVAAQRMIKALGTFGNQIAVRGREHYASAIPRTLRRLDRLLPEHEETAPLHRLLREASLL